jgi:hypothetical protein
MTENLIKCSGCGLLARAGACVTCPACNADMVPNTPDDDAASVADLLPSDEAAPNGLTDAGELPESVLGEGITIGPDDVGEMPAGAGPDPRMAGSPAEPEPE